MEAAIKPHLIAVPDSACPTCERLEAEAEEMDRKYRGALLQARKAREDAHAKLWGSPERPMVEALHACHHAATKANKKTPTRSKKLDSHELDCAYSTLHAVGFLVCLQAVVGIAYDPNVGPPRRNKTREVYNTFELAIRNSAKATAAAERIPEGWTPNVEKVSLISGYSEEQIREWLGEES